MGVKSISILIIIVAIGVFSWFLLASEKESAIPKEIGVFPSTSSTRDISVQKSPENKPRFTTLPFPEKQVTRARSYTIEKELPALKPKIASFQEIGSAIENTVSYFFDDTENQSKTENTAQPEPKRLSSAEIEKQVFETLFPDYVINFYTDLQQAYIDDGYVSKNYEKIESFDSEEKIFAFVNTSIDIAEEQGFISKKEAQKSRIGANQILRAIYESEKLQLQKELIGSDFYNRIFANRLNYLHRSVDKKIVRFLEMMKNITTKEVYAADCYRSGAASPGGTNNSHVWCCNCGENMTRNGPVFVQDCGTRCNYRNYGCKNGPGGGFRPVIWDPSGICGVG
ncbi:MAG: hypothetical protein ACE5F2_02435 [Candidatus Paceibacteria bacterium]